MMMISLPSGLNLGSELSKFLGLQNVEVIHKVFPDGETYLRLPNLTLEEQVMLVQTLYPEQDRRIVELLYMVETLKSRGVKNIYAVIPYLAYSRQDKEFLEGEVVSVNSLLKLMKCAGVEKVFVVDLHSEVTLHMFKDFIENLIPVKTFAKYLSERVGGNILLVAPDVGALKRVKPLSDTLKTDYIVVSKFRDRVTGQIVHELPTEVNIEKKRVVIVDDIISTGGTISSIAMYFRKLGVNEIYVLASHGLFVGNALEKLNASGVTRVAVLNTTGVKIVHEMIEYLNVSEELANFIKEKLSLSM